MNKLPLIVALGLATSACFQANDTDVKDDTDISATGDSWTYYPVEISGVTYGYDESEWTYSVELVGWAQTVHLTITQDTTSPWEEDHDLVNAEYAMDGTWDLWAVTLPITADWSTQESGSNTLFAGDAAMEATMAWRVDAYEDGIVVDCVVWAGSASSTSLVDTGDCRELTF